MKSGGPIRKDQPGHSAGRHNPIKNKRKPPRGMYLNHEDVMNMQSGTSGQAEAILKQLDAEIITSKHQVRNNKQTISNGKASIQQGIDAFRPPEQATRINPRWTNEELLLAVQGVRKYGKDFKAIAELIGNKTEPHVRSFFVNYRRRYNLDEVLAEYEAEYGPDQTKDTENTQAEKEKNGAQESAAVIAADSSTTNGNAAPVKTSPTKPHQRLLPAPRTSAPPPLVKAGPASSKPQAVTTQS